MAVLDGKKIVFEKRIILTVKEGTVGLRQSDAFFQHVQNLPKLYSDLVEVVDPASIKNVVVSHQPRNVLGSYMPVFTAGLGYGQVISKSLAIPLIKISHQENHLYAVLREFDYKHFIGVHISGGTSEILDVTYKDALTIKILGTTLDLSFGKLIDRLGVYMGLAFPCGKEMDRLAGGAQATYGLKKSIKGMNFNISGLENKLKSYYDKDKDIGKISKTLFEFIASLLEEILSKNQALPILVSGGVAANAIIRKRLEETLESIYFCDPNYATDHSIGNAYYGSIHET